MPSYWEIINKIVEESDVVLEVLDARMPEFSRNEELEKLILDKNKRLILVLNKADMVSKKTIENDKRVLKNFTETVYISSVKNQGIQKLVSLIFKNLRDIKKNKERRHHIGVVGYPNTGKSSLINALTKRRRAKVSKKAGTTHGIQWIRFNDEIKILDSPGIIPFKEYDIIKYGLLGVKEPQRLKEPEVVAFAVIEMFMKKNKLALEKFFSISTDIREDTEQIFKKIALIKNYLKKGGLVDENRTSLFILKSWHEGKLML